MYLELLFLGSSLDKQPQDSVINLSTLIMLILNVSIVCNDTVNGISTAHYSTE